MRVSCAQYCTNRAINEGSRARTHTYLLTPWCRVLLEKLTGLQLVKKFPAFYGTRRFITALTSFRQLSLSWASPIQSIYPHRTSWRSILILSTHLRLGFPSELMHSINKYGFRCASLQEIHNHSVHFVEICTEFCPNREKECNKYKQNSIYSNQYSQFATAPIVTKLTVP